MASKMSDSGRPADPARNEIGKPDGTHNTIALIRRDFGLSSDVSDFLTLIVTQEDLFDDFGCNLKWPGAGMPTQGRLYITDKFICFSSTLIGDRKCVSLDSWFDLRQQKLKFAEIKAIQKNKIMGLFNSGIIIEYANPDT